jgi:hypothetical protein
MMAQKQASALTEKLTKWWLRRDEFDPCCVFTNPAVFIESYAIRGALKRVEWMEQAGLLAADAQDVSSWERPEQTDGRRMNLAEDALIKRDVKDVSDARRLLEGAYAFCDLVVHHQGQQGPPETLMMGYCAEVVDGKLSCACVADQASIASAVVHTIMARPSHPNADKWLNTIELYANWVIDNFTSPNGAFGVGIFSFEWNPILEYWCATSLASSVMFRLAKITGKEKYATAALGALNWLAQFDHTKVEIPMWEECAPEVAIYSFEGMVDGVRHLVETQGVAAARQHPVVAHFRVMTDWLIAHQGENGRWPEPRDRGYRDYSCGIPWLMLEMDALIGPDPRWKACAQRFLAGLNNPEGEDYYGLYVRPFTMGLAWLSAVTADILN